SHGTQPPGAVVAELDSLSVGPRDRGQIAVGIVGVARCTSPGYNRRCVDGRQVYDSVGEVMRGFPWRSDGREISVSVIAVADDPSVRQGLGQHTAIGVVSEAGCLFERIRDADQEPIRIVGQSGYARPLRDAGQMAGAV